MQFYFIIICKNINGRNSWKCCVILSHLGSMWGSNMENRLVELYNDCAMRGKSHRHCTHYMIKYADNYYKPYHLLASGSSYLTRNPSVFFVI